MRKVPYLRGHTQAQETHPGLVGKLVYAPQGILSRLPFTGRNTVNENHLESGRQLSEKFSKLGGCLELRNRIECFESAGESVRQAPHGSWRELRVLRLEVVAMDLGQQALGSIEL